MAHSSHAGCHICSLLVAKLGRLPENRELAAEVRRMPEAKMDARFRDNDPIFDAIFLVTFGWKPVVNVVFRTDERCKSREALMRNRGV